MSSEYMRKLMETVETQHEEQVDEGVLDAIEDYFVDKGLEWQGKYSQKALGKLDTRQLARTVYEVYKYHLGKTGQDQSMKNLMQFFQKIIPNLHGQTVTSIMKQAGVKYNKPEGSSSKQKKAEQPKKQNTEESFVFIKSLMEQKDISDREVKKAIRAFVSYLTQQEADQTEWLNNLIKYASDKQRQSIEKNLGQAAEEVADGVESNQKSQKTQDKTNQKTNQNNKKDRKKQQTSLPNRPILSDYAEAFGVSEDALRGLKLAWQLKYFPYDGKREKLKFNRKEFIDDLEFASSDKPKRKNMVKGKRRTPKQMDHLNAFFDETGDGDPEKVIKMITTIFNKSPEFFKDAIE
jgi:hypothetical protein